MDSTINIDFIACIKKIDNGDLAYEEVPIEKKNKELMSLISDMIDNNSFTLLDMQFRAKDLVVSRNEHNVCIPHPYNSANISSLKLPPYFSFEVYQNKIREMIEVFRKEKNQMDKVGKPYSIEEELRKFNRYTKFQYWNLLKYYVDADEYVRQLAILKMDLSYVMYSTENIGWTTYNYPISKYFVRINDYIKHIWKI